MRASLDATLARQLLAACRLARHAGFPAVAEHVLCALEELARCAPAQRTILDSAYLDLGKTQHDGSGGLQ